MATIPLNRRFIEWGEGEPPDPDIQLAMGLGDRGFDWQELLAKYRAVILAEAGSGKSTEMEEQVRLLTAAGKFAFYARVEDVGHKGLENALGLQERTKLAAWRESGDNAWFLTDSVDQAKSAGVRFDSAVRGLADGLQGFEERAHVIFSGRFTDWEYRRDLESFRRWLPVVLRDTKPQLTRDDEILRVVNQQSRRKETQEEQPVVLRMAPLDDARVRAFAIAKGVPNIDEFLGHIEAANLWHFAGRPLDLDWLARFWQEKRRLGSLSEMLELSVIERLQEPDTGRARRDPLDTTKAIQAIERIGGALVFSRKMTISIPDSEIAFPSDAPIDLSEVLPDWSASQWTILLTRPVFDPATLGRARFHNDNQGVVRSYLAARWLRRLRAANLPTRALLDLLFTKSYGVDVVKPSLRETAAWLSLWDSDVAREVVRRDSLLLLDQGDPASLPLSVRRDALTKAVDELATDPDHLSWFDNDKLRRFAQPDLGPIVCSLWPKYHKRAQALWLLLRIVWLGALKDCAQLASTAAFDSRANETTRILAGRALFATVDDETRKRYAMHIVNERSALPSRAICEAMVELFPAHMTVDDVVAIVETADLQDVQAQIDFRAATEGIAGKLQSASDVGKFLVALLRRIGEEISDIAHRSPARPEEACFPAIMAATSRLLELSPPDEAPELAIEAVFRVGNRLDRGVELETRLAPVRDELQGTSSRRRWAFWHAVGRLRQGSRRWADVQHLWHLDMAGYPAGLRTEDVDWLMADALERNTTADCVLAVNSAVEILKPSGILDELPEAFVKAIRRSELIAQAYENWLQHKIAPSELSEMEREREEYAKESAAKRDRDEQSWVQFAHDLQGDVTRIASLKTPSSPNVNSDLVILWRLLDGASRRSRYALDTVAPLERMFGAEITEAVRQGLIAHWRCSAPSLRSTRQPDTWNSTSRVDLMSIVGVSLEAAAETRWAERLSSSEATAAAGYGTLEINGFPPWLSDLARAKPQETLAVLWQEISVEISSPQPNAYDILTKVCHSDGTITRLVAPAVVAHLEKHPSTSSAVLTRMLQTIVQGIGSQGARFIRLGIEQFKIEKDIDLATQHIAAVFTLDPELAAKALASKMRAVGAKKQREYLDKFLALTFGDAVPSAGQFRPIEIKTETLLWIVRLMFKTHRHGYARTRPAGVVYLFNEHDRSEWTRGTVFNRLAATPGPATFQALLRLANDPVCPIPAKRMRALAMERAIQDSESGSWTPSEAFNFERDHETAPTTAKDLQIIVRRRIEDMEHDLVDGDSGQGRTVKSFQKEVDVQNWVARELRAKQGRSYSLEREPRVADEKEPDVRLCAKASDARVAIEIKVAETWTLKELEKALKDQLCGRYLRAVEGKHGILLLIHQKPKRWKHPKTGRFLSFEQIVKYLSKQALRIASAKQDSPQPEICTIDVSRC